MGGKYPNGKIWLYLKEGNPNSSQFGNFLKKNYPNYGKVNYFTKLEAKFTKLEKILPNGKFHKLETIIW